MQDDKYGVELQIQLISVNDVDIKNEITDITIALMMEWVDDRLKWTPTDYRHGQKWKLLQSKIFKFNWNLKQMKNSVLEPTKTNFWYLCIKGENLATEYWTY